MNKPLLTISLLSAGRPASLWQCLDSLKLITDHIDTELIIVDTGCPENILQRIRTYTDHIIPFTWCNDFSAARNVGLFAAKGEWFLFLDDDEYFVNAEPIVQFFQSGEYKDYDTACYRVRNFLDKQGRRYEDGWVTRMKRIEPGVKFVSRIHEYMVPMNLPSKLLPAMVEHYGYAFDTQEERRAHSMRNIPPLLEMIKEEPEKLQWLFQLVQEYMATEEFDKAIETCRNGIEKIDRKPDPSLQDIQYLGFFYASGATALIRAEENEAGDQLAMQGLGDQRITDLQKARLLYIHADEVMKRGKVNEGEAACLEYLKIYESLKDDMEAQHQQGSTYIRDAFTTSVHDPVCCLLIKCGAAKKTDAELLKYFGKISWGDAAVYAAPDTLEDIFETVSQKDPCPEYRQILAVLCQNEQLCTSAMKAYESWRARPEVTKKQVERIADLFRQTELPVYENLYLRIVMADALGDKEKLTACYHELFTKFADLFHFSDEYFAIAERAELPIGELLQEILFEQWKDGVRIFCADASPEQIRARFLLAERHLEEQSIRLQYFRITAYLAEISKMPQDEKRSKDDHKALGERFRSLSDAILCFYGPYYTDRAFEGDLKMLPAQCRGAICLGMLLEHEEAGNLSGVKSLIGDCAEAFPEIKEVLLGYVREMADLYKEAESNRNDEMAYLAAILKKKAKELEAKGNPDAARQIREQLSALGML